jgi:signal transduction histidine kinase
MIEIIVRDYGLGIPANDALVLFQRFARLPRDMASKVIGNGLGLYLCRVLAEVMDGRVWLESAGVPGKGTTFYVRLPIAAAPGSLNPTPPAEPMTVESVPR